MPILSGKMGVYEQHAHGGSPVSLRGTPDAGCP
jgi:hypothetical protein